MQMNDQRSRHNGQISRHNDQGSRHNDQGSCHNNPGSRRFGTDSSYYVGGGYDLDADTPTKLNDLFDT